MKKIFSLIIPIIPLLLTACQKDNLFKNEDSTLSPALKNFSSNSGQIKIAVLSDIHYMHASLLQNGAQNGTAFKSIFLSEPYKVLLEHSPAIFSSVVSDLMKQKPDFVLVSGDMAKDGEKLCHETVAGIFNLLQNNGIKVFLVPGNNDINNNSSVAYSGNSSTPVPNISPAEFLSIYGAFGYNTAKSHDPNSLSYVAEAAPGVWILAIDAERYSPVYDRSGRIKPETMNWIKGQMNLARQNKITVLGLMHHNIVEHFPGQAMFTPKTLVEDLSGGMADNNNWKSRADSLASWGLNIMFTGHSHVTDISLRTFNGNNLYDVATGSLVTPPSPYRMVILKNKEIEIYTNRVQSISATFPNNQSFEEYSNQFLSSSFDDFFSLYLAKSPFSLKEPLLSYAKPLARNAYMAYIAGDEKISPLEQMKIDSLASVSPRPDTTLWAIKAFWTDLGIKDQKWHVKQNIY